MNQKTKLVSLISAAAASLGLALSASAQTATAEVPASFGNGAALLGSGYTSVAYRYTDLDNGPPSALRGAVLTFNQPLQAGLDFTLSYDWARASADPIRLTNQDLNAGVTAFSKLEWGKPYVQALAGWEWRRGAGFTGNSFAYTLGTGMEFQAASELALTPYINFVRATHFSQNEVDYGVKATYRITRQWGVTAGYEYDAVQHAKDRNVYTLGVNYHY